MLAREPITGSHPIHKHRLWTAGSQQYLDSAYSRLPMVRHPRTSFSMMLPQLQGGVRTALWAFVLTTNTAHALWHWYCRLAILPWGQSRQVNGHDDMWTSECHLTTRPSRPQYWQQCSRVEHPQASTPWPREWCSMHCRPCAALGSPQPHFQGLSQDPHHLWFTRHDSVSWMAASSTANLIPRENMRATSPGSKVSLHGKSHKKTCSCPNQYLRLSIPGRSSHNSLWAWYAFRSSCVRLWNCTVTAPCWCLAGKNQRDPTHDRLRNEACELECTHGQLWAYQHAETAGWSGPCLHAHEAEVVASWLAHLQQGTSSKPWSCIHEDLLAMRKVMDNKQ